MATLPTPMGTARSHSEPPENQSYNLIIALKNRYIYFRGSTMPDKKRSHHKNFPPIIWTQIRALYESGLYSSLDDIRKDAVKIYKMCPSIDAMRNKAGVEDWNRKGYQEQLNAANERNIQRCFDEMGFTKNKVVEYIVTAVKVTYELYMLSKQKIDDGLKQDIIPPEIVEELIEFRKVLRDHLAALGEVNKMMGNYTAARGAGEGRGLTGSLSPDIEDDLTFEEMLKERERIGKVLAGN
jgi:hypothetical protein